MALLYLMKQGKAHWGCEYQGQSGLFAFKMVDYMILRGRSKAEDQDHIFELQEKRVPWDKAPEGRGARDSWLTFKDYLVLTQVQQIPVNSKSGKSGRRLAWVSKGTQIQKTGIQNVEAGTGNLRAVQRCCPRVQGCSQKSQSPAGTESGEECQKQGGLV